MLIHSLFMCRWPHALLACLLCWVCAAGAQTAAPRMALLIGNSAYKGNWPVLKNTVNDARDLGQRLKELGWQTTVTENRTGDQMLSDVQGFIERAQKAKAGQMLLYFSGHGLEWEKGAYLVPVDLRSDNGLEVAHKAMELQKLVTSLNGVPGLKLVILDACRTRPGIRGDAGGLPPPDAKGRVPDGVLVSYATESMQVAMDDIGQRNGVYASGLLKALEKVTQIGGSFTDVMTETEEQVRRLSREHGREQKPMNHVSLALGKQFVFANISRKVPLPSTPAPLDNGALSDISKFPRPRPISSSTGTVEQLLPKED